MDDSRMNVSVALTAIMAGAACTNYVEVTELIKDAAGQVCNAQGQIIYHKSRENEVAGFAQDVR
jgi:glycerol-3-phosphate dehydrogenase